MFNMYTTVSLASLYRISLRNLFFFLKMSIDQRQTMAHRPNLLADCFSKNKNYWRNITPICFLIASTCFHILPLNICSRDHKPKIFKSLLQIICKERDHHGWLFLYNCLLNLFHNQFNEYGPSYLLHIWCHHIVGTCVELCLHS